jgi:hypothetical protein
MKLEELIHYLIDTKQVKNLYQERDLNTESEALLIYLKGALDLKSEISFFVIEETNDNLVFEKDGEKYFQLFPIEYAIDLIEYDLELKNKGYSHLEIAKRLLDYRLKDA